MTRAVPIAPNPNTFCTPAPVPEPPKISRYNASEAIARLKEAMKHFGYPDSIWERRVATRGPRSDQFLHRGLAAVQRSDVWDYMLNRCAPPLSPGQIARASGTCTNTIKLAMQRREARREQAAAPPGTPWRHGNPKPPTRPVAPPAASYGVAGELIALGGDFPKPKTGKRRLIQTPDPWARDDKLENTYQGRTTDIAEDDE